MRISARCDYACRAVLELAIHWPNPEPLRINTISKRQGIPLRYLVQILIQLKRLRFVTSVRGRAGGYNLTKPPAKISLGHLMREIGGPILVVYNGAEKNKSVFVAIWRKAETAMAEILDKVTFEDIVNKTKDTKRVGVYQI